MSLEGKTLFVTGASRGIGLAIALRAARDGANVAIAAKTSEPHKHLPGTIYSAAEEIEKAALIWPTNPDLKAFATQVVLGQEQVVRRDLGGHVDPARLRGADDVDRAGGGHVADVQGRAGVRGQQAVPRDDRFLRGGRPAGPPPELSGKRPGRPDRWQPRTRRHRRRHRHRAGRVAPLG